MALLKRIAEDMGEIESKKVGLRRGLLTLMLEWKSFEQHLDMTGTRLKECFDELESKEKDMCRIQESIRESLKELELVRESLNAKCEQVEDKERQISGYVDDLKMREEKLNEKEMSIRGVVEEFENVIEGRIKEIGMKEKEFYELAYELDSREEKLKKRENELKVREEELDSALLFKKLDSAEEVVETSSLLSPRACDSTKRIWKQKRTKLAEFCSNNPLKRPKSEKSSEYSMDVDTSNARVDSESESDNTDHEGITQVRDCPRAKFHDFDKEKGRENFDVDQIWACYDDLDGMPRLYARVEKIFTNKFELQMVWLEADAEEDRCTNHELQVSCGRFRLGNSLDVSTDLIFSHRVDCKRDVKGYYLIYPTKGETWAIWNSERLEDHHRYEIVEVLSDFVDDVGITVSYLDKVSGFTSGFERRRRGSNSFVIAPDELRRFSHKVPSFKLTETINECSDCFELDPASLPVDYEQADDVSTFEMDQPDVF